MHDLMKTEWRDWLVQMTGGIPRSQRGLDPSIGENDCGSWLAVPYFVSFELLCFVLLLNGIAVLLAHFAPDGNEHEGFISTANSNAFAHEWSKFDPLATRLVPSTVLPVILRKIDAPLGVKNNKKKFALFKVLRTLSTGKHKLTLHAGGQISFHETLMCLCGRHFDAVEKGLGGSRFAAKHEAEVRGAMLMHKATALAKQTTFSVKAALRAATSTRRKSSTTQLSSISRKLQKPRCFRYVELSSAPTR